MKKNVSILTVSQISRFPCLKLLRDMLLEQTGVEKIKEWVIVEGSLLEDDCNKNKENILSLQDSVPFPIVYVPTDGNNNIGHLRNRSNEFATGDIIICMDDDDYYFPSRVDHVVKSFSKNPSILIAGCSECMLYDYILEKQFKCSSYGKYHSTNNAFAYRREYIKNHKYDDNKKHAEEFDFTNGFKEPMIQLDTDKTMIVSSHSYNTYNKRKLLVAALLGTNTNIKPMQKNISEKYYNKYRELFRKEETSPYDIIYNTGCFSIDWNPEDKSLGGSEQAVVHLATEWAKLGYKVAVYGNVPTVTYNGVDYFPYGFFPYDKKLKNVVLWRLSGIASVCAVKLDAKHILLDLHDNFTGSAQIIQIYKTYANNISRIMFKSEYHRDEFLKATSEKLDNNRHKIIMNGIRTDIFRENKENVLRNKYRFCYCSCYTRGLLNILKYIWPVIYAAEPRAELHVYYGMNYVPDEKFKQEMTQLLATNGVMDHGRQGVDIINREKHMSMFHLYVTNSTAEIDCISIRESLVAGCIPIISTSNLFKNRDGIRFPMENDQQYLSIGHKIVNMLKNNSDETFDLIRSKLMSSETIVSWEDVSKKWLNEFCELPLEKETKEEIEKIEKIEKINSPSVTLDI